MDLGIGVHAGGEATPCEGRVEVPVAPRLPRHREHGLAVPRGDAQAPACGVGARAVDVRRLEVGGDVQQHGHRDHARGDARPERDPAPPRATPPVPAVPLGAPLPAVLGEAVEGALEGLRPREPGRLGVGPGVCAGGQGAGRGDPEADEGRGRRRRGAARAVREHRQQARTRGDGEQEGAHRGDRGEPRRPPVREQGGLPREHRPELRRPERMGEVGGDHDRAEPRQGDGVRATPAGRRRAQDEARACARGLARVQGEAAELRARGPCRPRPEGEQGPAEGHAGGGRRQGQEGPSRMGRPAGREGQGRGEGGGGHRRDDPRHDPEPEQGARHGGPAAAGPAAGGAGRRDGHHDAPGREQRRGPTRPCLHQVGPRGHQPHDPHEEDLGRLHDRQRPRPRTFPARIHPAHGARGGEREGRGDRQRGERRQQRLGDRPCLAHARGDCGRGAGRWKTRSVGLPSPA